MDTTDIILFDNPEFGSIRTAIIDGKPMFNLKDIADFLEIQDRRQLRERLDAKGVSFIHTPTAGGPQQMTYVSEPNMYRCIFQSRKDNAVKFQDWICEEVLPSLRQTGEYRLSKENKMLKDRIEAMETTMIPIISVSITMDDYAQVLSTYSGNEIGRTKLMDLLRKLGYIQKTSNLPYQAYLDRKFFVVVASSGHKRPSARITPKGQRFVSRRLMRILPVRIPISIPLF